MADTTPLRREADTKKAPLSDVETNNLGEIYRINSNGFYGNHEYTDLALLLKRNVLK